MASFEFEHVTKRYKDGFEAVRNLPGRSEGARMRTAIDEIEVPDRLRPRRDPARRAARASVIVGIPPEHLEDATLVGDRPDGHTIKATVDVLESVGSKYYAHFTVPSEPLPAIALGAVTQDHGSADSPRFRDGVPMVARLGRASRGRQGDEAELWFDIAEIQRFDDHGGQNRLANERRAKALAPPPAPRTDDVLRAAGPRRGLRMYPVDVRPLRPAPSGSAAYQPLAYRRRPAAGGEGWRAWCRLGHLQMRPRGVGREPAQVREKGTGGR